MKSLLSVLAVFTALMFINQNCQKKPDETNKAPAEVGQDSLADKTLITKAVSITTISLDEAQKLTDRYHTFTNKKVLTQNLAIKKIIDLMHENHCEDCTEDERKKKTYPSYNIPRDVMLQILDNKNVKRIVFYPAAHPGPDDKHDRFTFILVGADENGKVVLRQKKIAGADDYELWEHIDPCPPPNGCQQIGQP